MNNNYNNHRQQQNAQQQQYQQPPNNQGHGMLGMPNRNNQQQQYQQPPNNQGQGMRVMANQNNQLQQQQHQPGLLQQQPQMGVNYGGLPAQLFAPDPSSTLSNNVVNKYSSFLDAMQNPAQQETRQQYNDRIKSQNILQAYHLQANQLAAQQAKAVAEEDRLRNIEQLKPKYPEVAEIAKAVTRHFPLNPLADIAIWTDPGKAMSDVTPEDSAGGLTTITTKMCKMEQLAACRARATRYNLQADVIKVELAAALLNAKTVRGMNVGGNSWTQVSAPESDIHQYESFCFADAITLTHTTLANLQANICFPCEVKVIPCYGRDATPEFTEYTIGKKQVGGCKLMRQQLNVAIGRLQAPPATFVDGSQRFITLSKDVLDRQDALHRDAHLRDTSLPAEENRAIYCSSGFPISVPETQMTAVSLYYSAAAAGAAALTVVQAKPKLVALLKDVTNQGYHSVCIQSNLFANNISPIHFLTALKEAIEALMNDAAHTQTLLRVVLQVMDLDQGQHDTFLNEAFGVMLPPNANIQDSRKHKHTAYQQVLAQYPPPPQDDSLMQSAAGSASKLFA